MSTMKKSGFDLCPPIEQIQSGLLPERQRVAYWPLGLAMFVLGAGLAVSGGVQAKEDSGSSSSPRQCSNCVAIHVNAGSDQTVNAGATVTLSGSIIPTVIEYSWSQTSGPSVTLSNSDTSSPSFTAPNVSSQTHLVFRLTGSAAGSYSGDSVTITVNPASPPTVNAGTDKTVNEGAYVRLSGSGDGSLSWSQTSGPTVTLYSSTTATPSFRAPYVSRRTSLEFTLTATQDGQSATDTVAVTVNNVPQPTANAGSDQVVAEGDTVQLSGSGSGTSSWSQTSGTPTVTLTGATTATPSFTAPEVTQSTNLIFTLTKTLSGRTATDTVTVTVVESGSEPQAAAGLDQEAVGGATVTLDGSGSSAPNGVQSYAWTQTSGVGVTLNDADQSTATFTAPSTMNGRRIIEERLEFTLTVTDQVGLVSTDTLEVVVTTGAVVSGVSIISRPLSGDTYGEGDRIRARVTYDEVVRIGGSPRLDLEIGTQTRGMTYVGMDRSRVLDFEYVVRAADADPNGVGITSDLSLPSGASITNKRGMAASLSLGRTIQNASGHKVDGSQAVSSPTPGVTGCSQ